MFVDREIGISCCEGMKLWILLLVWSAGIAGAGEVQVRVVRQKKEIPAPQNAAFVSNVVALVRGCSVDSTVSAVKPDTWEQTLRSDSFVHVTFPGARKISVMGSDNQAREERAIDEILVPLPERKWPAQIFAKS